MTMTSGGSLQLILEAAHPFLLHTCLIPLLPSHIIPHHHACLIPLHKFSSLSLLSLLSHPFLPKFVCICAERRASSMAAHRWKSFFEDEDQPEKPCRFGVTEIRGPNYSRFSQNVLEVILFVNNSKLPDEVPPWELSG